MFLQRRKTGHVADREQIMGYQHGRRGGADGGHNAPREMKLADGFHQ